MATSLGRKAATGVVLVAFGTAVGGPAVADPVNAPNAERIPLTCGDQTYDIVVNGNGDWSPAHDTASTRMFIPTSFGEFSITVTNADGKVVDSETDPPSIKGSSDMARGTSVECTFAVEDDVVDPVEGPLHIAVSGSVNGFVTPASG
jgi:hypothetical protein